MKGRDLVETSLLYVGIPAFTLYPLGFVALGIEMLRDPFFPYYDFDTVWNAVSLVPQTVVIGTGVRLFYLSLISTALGVGIASLTYRLFHRRLQGDEAQPATIPLSGWWRLYAVVLLPVAALLLWNTVTVEGWGDVGFVAGFLGFSTGSGLVIGYARSGSQKRHFFAGMLVAYAGAILAALCISAIQDPQLPLVEVNAQVASVTACSEVPTERLFVLLAESEAYWYVYNSDGLLALPNGDAQVIRYRDCPGFSR